MKNVTKYHTLVTKLALVASIFLFALCMGNITHAQAKSNTISISTASDFHKISTYNGGTFHLTKDIKLTKKSQYLTISKNKTYTIDLNGHKITANSYTSGKIRDDVPILLQNGTLKIKNSASKKGYLSSTEGATVFVTGGKLYTYKNVVITCDNVGFMKDAFGNTISNQASAIAMTGGNYYAKGGNIYGVINGLSLYGGNLYTYGAGTKTYPSFKGTYGNGLYIVAPSGAKVTLKGGSFISCTSNLSGYYPICDYYGNVISLPKGYSFCDASGTKQQINSFGYAKYVASNYDKEKKWQWVTMRKKGIRS